MCQANDKYQYVLKTLGQNIRKARKEKKLSQEKLAFAVETARNYIGCIERAEKVVGLKILCKISDVLNVRLEDLFKNTI